MFCVVFHSDCSPHYRCVESIRKDLWKEMLGRNSLQAKICTWTSFCFPLHLHLNSLPTSNSAESVLTHMKLEVITICWTLSMITPKQIYLPCIYLNLFRSMSENLFQFMWNWKFFASSSSSSSTTDLNLTTEGRMILLEAKPFAWNKQLRCNAIKRSSKLKVELWRKRECVLFHVDFYTLFSHVNQRVTQYEWWMNRSDVATIKSNMRICKAECAKASSWKAKSLRVWAELSWARERTK